MERIKLWADSPIKWQQESKDKLNKIIKKFNKFIDKKERLEKKLIAAKEELDCLSGCGDGYLEEIDRMFKQLRGFE